MNKELKPTFKLTYTELNVCFDNWIENHNYMYPKVIVVDSTFATGLN